MTSNDFVQEPILPEETPTQENAEEKTRREKYKARLAAYLKDPEFRKIEGFPHGTDEAILALSDPPFYTACPNPFLPEILEEWQAERRQIREDLGLLDDETPSKGKASYHREPFAADVSEGKNDPIYNAHSYHTKVPHKAIMRYILHYTDPGDIVFDGFCGTGMTGVAAQLCGDKAEVESLGYRVDEEGVIYDGEKVISHLGARKAVLNDLSPAATFIAYNYNTPADAKVFEKEAKRILKEVEKEWGWMYETWHPHCDDPNRVKGKINYTVWSDVFRCPQCGHEMVFWDVAVDKVKGSVNQDWECPGCTSLLSKSPRKDSGALRVERVMDAYLDSAIGEVRKRARQVPTIINYTVGRQKYEKKVDERDIELCKVIEELEIPYSYPCDPLMFVGKNWGDTWRAGYHAGITHVHHFFTKRNLIILSSYLQKIYNPNLLFLLTGSIVNISKLYRFRFNGKGGNVSGTLYIPSTPQENNAIDTIRRKIKFTIKGFVSIDQKCLITSSDSSEAYGVQKNAFDYIFIDPPFGANLMYSELNFIWESIFGVFTNNKSEAIINSEQKKKLFQYELLMEKCLIKFSRLLQPGHWITVEFHNSQNSVWNAIQEALVNAGFVIADVSTLDKQQGTFKQITTTSAVKQDLIISAYKPSSDFEKGFSVKGGTVQGAWDFIQQHLDQLSPPEKIGGRIEIQAERTPYLLYDRMLAFHLVRGLTIPLSSSEFYQGLSSGPFLMREGMVFTIAQAHKYDQLRLSAEGVQQLALFVTDEASAVQWLRGYLSDETGEGSQTYAEIQPNFLKQLHQERYEDLPELLTILKENFLQDGEERWFVPDLSRQADLDQIREKALLREFNALVASKGKLKVFRSEAISAGFSKAWAQHDYDKIVSVANRLPEKALQEDPKLKLYVDNSRLRASRQPKQEKLL